MKSLFTFLFIALSLPHFVLANIINVPSDQPTIQDGINAAFNGDTVLVADNLYYENIDFKGKAITLASHFLINGDSSHISNTIIDGSMPSNPDSGSVVYFISGEDTNSVLCGFTINGGTGTHDNFWFARIGGGILMTSGAKITNNIISNNSAIATMSNMLASSGGIDGFNFSTNNNLIIEKNDIQNNHVEGDLDITGGGMSIYHYNYTRISNNIIKNNTINSHTNGAEGGGIYCLGAQNSNFLITNNIVSYNNVNSFHNQRGYGGGIQLREITNAIITDNIILV